MLNFKFLKRALVFFVLTFFMAGYSVASAGFITIYPDDKDSGLDNGMTAAVVDVVPAKTDGEIIDCFDYYRFPSIQTSFETMKEFYEPGQTVYFKGELINKNNYPIVDGYLFVRIARFNENYIQEGHDIVDEFFAKSGPQGREKFYLEGNEKKRTVFNWEAPENLPTGVYRVTFSFIVGKKMNLAGLSFTNEVVAGLTEFEVRKSAIGAKRVFLEKSSFAVNGNKYDHIGLWPQIDKGAKVEAAGKLKNETPKKENVQLVYDLYYWDGMDAQNKVSSRSEDITVAPNSSHSFKYIIPKMDETVYFLRITSIAGNNQKSIVNLRVVSEEERPRINFFSPLKFPVLKGETMTNFVCFHNTADKDAKGKVMMNVFDESGDKVQTLGYEGKITGKIMAVKKDAIASKNYSYLKMVASVSGANGRERDSYEMIYDCKNMNPENQECARIQEEKAKAIVDVSKPFNKKGVTLGIIALMAILAVIALSRKFLLNKTKPPLMFLLFAFIVGLTAFFASGINNQVWAKNITEAKNFRFPKGEADYMKHGGVFFIGGYVNIVHRVKRDNPNDTLKFGDKATFTYEPDNPFWGSTGASWDSPYGIWCDKGRLEKKSCLDKKDKSYTLLENFRQNDDNRNYYMTFTAEKPEVYLKSSDESIISCDGMVCAAKNKKGAATVTAHIGSLTAHIGSFIARPWVKVTANNGKFIWEGSGENNSDELYDLDFDSGASLKWDFVVDPPPVECNASFSPAEITDGDSTAFSWETKYDEDGIIPISCDGDIGNIDNSGAGSIGHWTNLKPTETQTCVATASNSNGAKSCSAKVTVSSIFPLTINKIGTGKGTMSLNVGSNTQNFSFDKPANESILAGPYESGTNVTLTAKATSSSTFKGWTGCSTTSGGGDNVCKVVMSAAQNITVNFDAPPEKCNYNGERDNGETGKDCGGGGCPACPFSDKPSKPQNFTASGICRKVNLFWDYSSEKIASYKITKDETVDETVTFTKDMNINIGAGVQNSYTDNSATDSSKIYSYTIKACNDQNKCSEDAGPATATPTGGICVVGDGGCTGDSSQSCGIDQNSRPSNTSSCNGSQSRVCANSSWGGWGSCGITTCACNGGYTWNSATQICDVVTPDYHNLTLKKNGSGNVQLYEWRDSPWNDYGKMQNSDFQNNETKGLKKNWWFKMTAAPDSGSYFSGWSECTSTSEGKSWTDADGVVHYSTPFSNENACYVTMSGNKTVTVTFNDSVVGCVGCGSSVKAYISARDTVVTDGNSTVVTWTSDNADSCEQKEVGSDTGWISASDTASGNYTTANFTTSGGSRTYTIECAKGSQKSGDVSVTVDVGNGYSSPSVTIWADPQSIGYKKTSLIKWLSSNVLPDCAVYSGSSYFGGGNNNLIGQNTGKLSSDTVYKIKCIGYGPLFAKVEKLTTVAVAKPVSNFTLTNPTGGKIVANIVEGLSANSNSIALALSGETIGNISLSASIPAISGAKAQFSSSADNGGTWSAWGNTPLNDIDISAISQIKIRAINIPGATATGTYNVAVTATDTGTGGKTKKLNVNLQVNRVSSEWEEF